MAEARWALPGGHPGTPDDRSRLRGVRVRDAAEARLALQVAARLRLPFPVPLVSAAGAAAWLGAPLFLAILAEAASAVPGALPFAVLDCGDAPGLALAALGLPLGAVILEPGPAFAAVAAAAAEAGTPLWPAAPPCLELEGRLAAPGEEAPGPTARRSAREAARLAGWWAEWRTGAAGDTAGRLG
jgi:hypothetical protein